LVLLQEIRRFCMRNGIGRGGPRLYGKVSHDRSFVERLGLEPVGKLALPLGSPFCYQEVMSKARLSDNKKKMGRPATGIGTMIGVRIRPDQLAALDSWIKHQPDELSRPEAVRRLMEIGLKGQ